MGRYFMFVTMFVTMVALLGAALSAAINYNSSKSNTGNIALAYPSTVTAAQAAAVLSEIEKSGKAPTETTVRSILTAKGIKQGGFKVIIEQKDNKTTILLLADPADEKAARAAAAKITTSRSNTQHNQLE